METTGRHESDQKRFARVQQLMVIGVDKGVTKAARCVRGCNSFKK
jgi:hypothetical protein